MKKVEGVQSVQVSLKDGLTILELRPGNKVTLAQLRTVIKDNGFVSKDAQIIARGTPVAGTFEVSGTAEKLSVSTAPVEAEGGRWRLSATTR